MSKRDNTDLIMLALAKAGGGGGGGGGGGDEANANIANSFSTGTDYAAGDYVIYGGQLFEFTTDKAAGGWDASTVERVTVGATLSILNNAAPLIDEDDDNKAYTMKWSIKNGFPVLTLTERT